ncbi:hypothetical protein D3C78_1925970 [compost metagenome]
MLHDVFQQAVLGLVAGIDPFAQLNPLPYGQFDAVPRTLEPEGSGVAQRFERDAVDTVFEAHEAPVQR